MKPKPNKRIDNLLREIGLPPKEVDPEAAAAHAPYASTAHAPTIGPCGKSCFPSESSAKKAGTRIKKRGANTSFLRPYFCPKCKAWHLTSAKNVGSSKSSGTTRNAGRNRRNHPQSPSTDES